MRFDGQSMQGDREKCIEPAWTISSSKPVRNVICIRPPAMGSGAQSRVFAPSAGPEFGVPG